MGCDIHLHFEKKNKEGKWEPIVIDKKLIPDDRNYDVFTFLAGVRGSFEGFFPRRGFPEGTTACVEETLDSWMGEHSFTHAYLDEILKAPWKEYQLDGCYFHIFCDEVLPRLVCEYGSCNYEEQRNIRVVMGFDG